ncbi:UDP-glucose 6-dehydrogenase [Butyricicoccus sp. MSJd-7]|uniref:UDP-glucose 6-dehydrogenase n=1 Tax=Butyricicoccus intestinisimiae TaxID=2841509 RepID=A0ABS6ENL7_9FIRM|nr:UDP-glucose 6-dehydrogenase [Butyricicoccus intestinisimiae]
MTSRLITGTGYVGLSFATLLSQHHKVTAVDIIPDKVELINNKKSPIQDEYIEKYLAEKDLDLTATLDTKEAYSDADFVVIAAPTNVYSTNRIDVATSKRTYFAHYTGHWNWLYFTAICTVNARCLYKTLNF